MSGLPAQREAGFTLPELLVSIAILGVILPAIALAVVMTIRTNIETSDRLDASSDRQFLAQYIADDVQAARKTTSGVPGISTGGDAATCGGFAASSYAFEVRGDAFDPDNPTRAQMTATTYVLTLNGRTVNGRAVGNVRRLTCRGTAASMTIQSDQVLARNVVSLVPAYADPTLTVTVTPAVGNSYQLVGTRRTS